ncbi:Na(+)/H(+) antiporter subunit C [Gordonia aurantiaca]|uniref:Na(+)/H(+) antiporter subunit C n=1 Tax=Gordonia sp. B21 TaxID=3151852 RepID=UPI00326682B6
MSTSLPLLLIVGAMAACGVYLLMERSLVRMLFGLLLCGNALNLMIVVISGGMGNPPILGQTSESRPGDADPLAQAMVLTAIVITMGVAAFVLSLVYRLFVINRDDDDVEDDTEDVKIKTGSLTTAPDRDRSDDPVTLSDTPTGDYFDDAGNPLTPEEVAERHRQLHETDIMPDSISDVVDELGSEDEGDDEDTYLPPGDPDLVGEKVADDDSDEARVIDADGDPITEGAASDDQATDGSSESDGTDDGPGKKNAGQKDTDSEGGGR